MSEFYTPKKTRNLYDPDSSKPFKLSRSRIEMFMECPKCFYIDNRLGVRRPPGFPFALNIAVDTLLKKEFDSYREREEKHPIIIEYGVDAVPVKHDDLEDWRNNFRGVQYLHEDTNFLLYGAIDDLWINSGGEYIVVDYKSTAKNEEITELDKDWMDGYKRQMEIYQWLLRQNGYRVSDTGYFVYCNGRTDLDSFNRQLIFRKTLIPYTGNDGWVEDVVTQMYECLNSERVPEQEEDCDFCRYREAVEEILPTS